MNTDILQTLEFHDIQKMLADHAVSVLSKEMAMAWKPSVFPEIVEQLLEETEEASVCLQREITSPLGETHDIREALDKSEKDIILLPQEFLALCSSLETYRKMNQYFDGERISIYPRLYELTRNILPADGLIEQIRRVFGDHGDVLDSASPKLARIRSEKNTLKDRIRRSFQHILQDKDQASYFQDSIITQRNGRYVIPVKAEYRYKFSGIVHDRSSTGQTIFMEPMISVQLNNDLAELNIQEKQEIHEIMRQLSGQVRKEAAHIRSSCKTATGIELIFARGELALAMKGIKAIHDEKGYAELNGARHPLIDPKNVVPLHIRLGRDFHILIITGSNAGGKTISMKTLGLLALMNQAGLFIPAEEGSRLPVYRHIYAVIGDDQSIQYNLSTFSSYVTQMTNFLSRCQPTDLVLLDELGSGTDPMEGAALAQAVTEYLNQRNVPAVITSHFSEMKKLAYETKGIENAFVEFDEKTLAPTYRLVIGMAGNSNAFNICRRLGMSEEILGRAETFKSESPMNNMETILAKLNVEIQTVEKERETLREKVTEAQQLRDELSHTAGEVREKKKEILDKAREEAERIKRELRVQSETIIKELKKNAAQLNRQGLMHQIDQTRRAVNQLEVPEDRQERRRLSPEEIKKGSCIYVDTVENVGIVQSVSGKKVSVRCGNLTLSVGLNHCFEAKKQEMPKPKQQETVRVGGYHAGQTVQSVTTRLNVIGLTVDEAIPQVDRFLNDAVMAGISPVEIIHGKGTGALRKGIQDYLRTLNFVAEFHNADVRNGGAGVTEVYF